MLVLGCTEISQADPHRGQLPSSPQVRDRVLRHALEDLCPPLPGYQCLSRYGIRKALPCRVSAISTELCCHNSFRAWSTHDPFFSCLSVMTITDQGDSDLLNIAEGNTA